MTYPIKQSKNPYVVGNHGQASPARQASFSTHRDISGQCELWVPFVTGLVHLGS